MTEHPYSDLSKEDDPWKDKELMLELYEEKNYTQQEIGDLFGISKTTVSTWLIKHRGDELRDGLDVDIPENRPYRDRKLLEKLYLEEELSSNEIAAVLDCSTGAVVEWMGKHGVDTREISEAISMARGGSKDLYFYTMKYRGYEAFSTVEDNLYVHRLQAVAYFGFNAVANNHVHHKNEIPWCNTEWNLELLDPSDHSTKHNGNYPEELRETAVEQYRSGKSSREVAEELGVSSNSVLRWVRERDPKGTRGPGGAGA